MTPSDFTTTFFRNKIKTHYNTKIQKSQKLNGILMKELLKMKNVHEKRKTDTITMKKNQEKKIATQLFTAFVKSF